MKHTPIALFALSALLVACSDKAPPAPASAPPQAAAPATPVAFAPPSGTRPSGVSATPKSTPHCSIDTISDVIAKPSNTVADKAQVKLHGWAADPDNGVLPKEVYVEIDGPSKTYVQATLGAARSDVATHFNKPTLANAGWNAQANVTSLSGAAYALRIIQVMPDGSSTICETTRVLDLTR